jgi:hypothetical protein
MEQTVINATEYREIPLAQLNESKTNPRRSFDQTSLKELADSIRSQGVLSPLLVRPLTENGYEIVAGARRYRAAQMAEQQTVPVRIKQISDAEALEAQLIEPDSRRDSPDGRSRRLRPAFGIGGAKVQHRANRRQGWKAPFVCRFETENDRPHKACRRCFLRR